MANILIGDLSLTISELIDLEPEQQNLIESAVNQVIAAKDIKGGLSIGEILPPSPPSWIPGSPPPNWPNSIPWR